MPSHGAGARGSTVHMSDVADTPEAATSKSGNALSALRHKLFRSVWLSNTASTFGGQVQIVGASWLMASLTQSHEMVALVQTASALPIMILSLLAGAIADNYDRRSLMLWAQIFMLTASALLTTLALFGLTTPYGLLLFTFLIGCGTAFSAPAWQASVASMVPRSELAAAVTLNTMGFNLARAAGPGVGGLVVAAAGAIAAFAINTISYLGLLVVLTRWKPELAPRKLPPERIDIAMGAGIRYVMMSPSILAVLLRSVAFGTAMSATTSLMPMIARDLLGGGPTLYGTMLGLYGVGAVAGGFAGHSLRKRMSNETLVRLSSLLFGACAAVAGLSSIVPVTLVALFFAGGAFILILSSLNVTVQLTSPRWVTGRALAVHRVALFGGIACGSWTWGILAEEQGLGFALVVSTAVHIVCAAIGIWRPLTQADDLNLDPLDRWIEPKTAVAIEPVSGPIVITIEYQIREADIMPFLAAMAQLRRVRRRDGARKWTLLRDLADAELWVERYHTPTWVEYVRHNQRRTHQDLQVLARIRKLHQGDEEPLIHRRIERQTGSLPAVRER